MTNPVPESVPEGSFTTSRAPPGHKRVDFVWRGHSYSVTVRPHTWGVEKRAIRETSDATGVSPGEFVDFMLHHLVAESTTPLKGPDLLAQDPDFVWTAARELGILAHLQQLGVKLLQSEAMQLTVRDIIREYFIIELKLRANGYTAAELDDLPPEIVRELYAAADEADTNKVERIAKTFAGIIAARMGI